LPPLLTKTEHLACYLGFYARFAIGSTSLKITQWVGHLTVYTNLEVDVRPKAVPGAAAVADHLALIDLLSGADGEGRLVGVTGGQTPAVVDSGVVPVAAAFGLRLGEGDGAREGGADRRAFRHGDVDPRVVLVMPFDRARSEA
jgi:hypothetical protein